MKIYWFEFSTAEETLGEDTADSEMTFKPLKNFHQPLKPN